MSTPVVYDLTGNDSSPQPAALVKKRTIADVTPHATSGVVSSAGITAAGTAFHKLPTKQAKIAAKKESAHALLWICAAGKGQGRQWKAKALKVIGVYANKAAAEKKKEEIMSRSTCCGHGDILVGDSWEDEIDLVVRPCEEVML
eukprot:gene20545-26646_t